MKKDIAKEIALVTAIILQEELINGGLMGTFDKVHDLASNFVDKFGILTGDDMKTFDFKKYNVSEGLDFQEFVVEYIGNIIYPRVETDLR